MDSRKPLTAGEIEELMTEALGLCESIKPGTTQGGVHRLLHILPRLLSMLTPPPDAAVREAVGFFAAMDNDCVDRPDEVKRQADILCRAVQAPRLTGEQREAVNFANAGLELAKCNCCAPGFICSRCAAQNALRVAFPEALAGEVDRG